MQRRATTHHHQAKQAEDSLAVQTGSPDDAPCKRPRTGKRSVRQSGFSSHFGSHSKQQQLKRIVVGFVTLSLGLIFVWRLSRTNTRKAENSDNLLPETELMQTDNKLPPLIQPIEEEENLLLPLNLGALLRRNETEEEAELDWGPKQLNKGGADEQLFQRVLDETENYMQQLVYQDPRYESVRKKCKNKFEYCAVLASGEACTKNPRFMKIHCAPACQSCDELSPEMRCPYDHNAPTALNEGDLDRLFERLTMEPQFAQYKPTILSRPTPTVPASNGPPKAHIPQEGPWVVTLEEFVTPQECDRLIQLGTDRGFARSADFGGTNFAGEIQADINEGRTSTNTWCMGDCHNDPLTQQVLERIESITGIPDANSEFLQLLRYEVGQRYQIHHDFVDFQKKRACGVRILTVFLYLSDVEEGGGTNFSELNMTVIPKKGKALVWPSVLNQDPNTKDPRTMHQALPVIRGTKFAANAWVHQRDFKEPFSRHC